MGFAAGFQVGAQAVERGLKMREEDELKRNLAQAYAQPESFTDYTPEQQKQIQGLQAAGRYDVQAVPGAEGQAPTLRYTARPNSGYLNEQGMPEAPIEIAPQRVQRYGGQTVAGQFSPEQLQGLQMREAARVIGASGDPVRASQLLAEANRLDREAVEGPLRLQALETQVKAGKLGLISAEQQNVKGEREAVTAKRMDDFNAWRSKNPQADFAAINAEVQRLGMGVNEQFKVASDLTGIGEQEFKASQQRIQKLVKNQGLDGLLKAHKESNDLDPGSHFEVIRGKGGTVSLNRVDTATGNIIQPNVFSGSEAEATAYLNKAAMDPATIIDFTMSLAKTKASIKQSEASAAKDMALGGLYAQGGAGAGKGTLKQKVADFKEVYGRDPSDAEKGVMAGLVAKDPNKPEFTPKEYALTVKGLTDAGMSLAAARADADQMYGRGPAAGNIDATLQKANAAKGAGLSKAPIEVQAGESRMTAPGAAVRGPLRDFMRESRRGMLGGVEYFYTDPVTNKRYTTEQYNQLLNQ
jgi:hypothetical protein